MKAQFSALSIYGTGSLPYSTKPMDSDDGTDKISLALFGAQMLV